jgi:ketosteroid isomerase-like protein
MASGQAVGTDLLKSLLEAFNHHDLDEVMTFFADDPVLEMPRGPEPWGRHAQGQQEVRRLLATRFEGIPDVHYSDDRHMVCGARCLGMASDWHHSRGQADHGQGLRSV